MAASQVIAARYRRFDGMERDHLIEPLRPVAHRGNYALGASVPVANCGPSP